MNKKQLIVAWVTGVLICCAVLFTPKMTTWQNGLLILRKDKELLAPLVNWSLVLSFILVFLIVGCLLIYTLRDQKK